MDIIDNSNDRANGTQSAKEEAQRAVLQLKSPALNTVINYLIILCENEMIRCGTQDDDVILRRAQGKAASLTATIELLRYEQAVYQSSVLST